MLWVSKTKTTMMLSWQKQDKSTFDNIRVVQVKSGLLIVQNKKMHGYESEKNYLHFYIRVERFLSPPEP